MEIVLTIAVIYFLLCVLFHIGMMICSSRYQYEWKWLTHGVFGWRAIALIVVAFLFSPFVAMQMILEEKKK